MLLNRLEYALMNNPIRATIQRRYEAVRLLKLGGPMRGGAALEIGCGRGVGAEIILDIFGADRVDGFDLDPRMVRQARQRHSARPDRTRFWVGDASSIAAPDFSYDAVFDFGIIHHIPDWRQALAEVRRVLRPGGRFYCEEVLDRFILNPLIRRLLDHPLEDRFNREGLCQALGEAGLEPMGSTQLRGWFAWVVAEARASEPE